MELINTLKDRLEQEAKVIIQIASESKMGGDENWDKCLIDNGLTPYSHSQREHLLQEGIKLKKGALPVELREVLKLILEKYQAENQLFHTENYSEETERAEMQKQIEANELYLSQWLESALNEYIKMVKYVSPTANIFANAMASTPKYVDSNTAGTSTSIRCKACGSAREAGSDLRICGFCGADLF